MDNGHNYVQYSYSDAVRRHVFPVLHVGFGTGKGLGSRFHCWRFSETDLVVSVVHSLRSIGLDIRVQRGVSRYFYKDGPRIKSWDVIGPRPCTLNPKPYTTLNPNGPLLVRVQGRPVM